MRIGATAGATAGHDSRPAPGHCVPSVAIGGRLTITRRGRINASDTAFRPAGRIQAPIPRMNPANFTMPALFVGHGSPMNAIEDNAATEGWRKAAARLPKPRAILVVSAHWE